MTPAAVAGFRKQQRLLDDFADRHYFMLGQRILRAHHQHELIAENGVGL